MFSGTWKLSICWGLWCSTRNQVVRLWVPSAGKYDMFTLICSSEVEFSIDGLWDHPAVSHSKILCLPVWFRSQETTCPGSCLLSVKTRLIRCNTINWVKCKTFWLRYIFWLSGRLNIHMCHCQTGRCMPFLPFASLHQEGKMLWCDILIACILMLTILILVVSESIPFASYILRISYLTPWKLTYWFTWKHGWFTWTSPVCKGESSEPYCSLLCSILI